MLLAFVLVLLKVLCSRSTYLSCSFLFSYFSLLRIALFELVQLSHCHVSRHWLLVVKTDSILVISRCYHPFPKKVFDFHLEDQDQLF